MLPIPQVLSQRFIASETESLRAISSIMPVEGTQADAPLWERMRPGTQFSGLIVQKDGASNNPSALALYKVQIQLPNQPAMLVQMQLPAHLAPQQTLNMQLMGLAQPPAKEVERYPQVKWGVQAGAANLTRGIASTLMTDLGASAAQQPLSGEQQTAQGQASLVELSNPARYLQRWLNTPAFQQQSAVLQSHNVVTQSPQKPQVLAQDLKHALDSSGLFYESHLKEATLGTRPWHQLMQEPQNQSHFSPPEMVAQQLQALEQQRVVWQGEVWPGQTMLWQISERENSQHSAIDPTVNSLQSNLTLQLPRLGEVAVRITMVNGRFNIRVQPAENASLKEMQSGRSLLTMNLQAAGLKLESLQVTRHEVEQHGQQYAAG